MKKLMMFLVAVTLSAAAMAQKELAFPFQGGQDIMTAFLTQNFVASDEMKQRDAAGVVVLKFTADANGAIQKIIVYYADDISLAQPAADLLKKSDRKWIIPDREKLHDFVLTLNIGFNPPVSGQLSAKKKFMQFYNSRSPLLTNNQVPLDMATLLPTLSLKYDVTP